MIYFDIVSNFTLTQEPSWLPAFRRKYDADYAPHITYKYPTISQEKTIEELEMIVDDIVKRHHKFKLICDTLYSNKTKHGHCVMICARKYQAAHNLQKELSLTLGRYGEVVDEEHIQFEKEFVPHITIARHLSDKEHKEAIKSLKGKSITCTAIIKNIELIIMQKYTPGEKVRIEHVRKFVLQ